MRRIIATVALSAAALFGCGETTAFVQDGGGTPNATPPDGRTAPTSVAWIFESFDNQQNIASVDDDALIDVNQGILTLPSVTIPSVDGDGTDMFRGRVEHNGLVEAEQIVVDAAASLEASDAVEMRARQSIEVIGNIRAGRGGVTLIGGHGVYVMGSIESRGPVRILVESADGEIVVGGRISVWASTDDLEQTPPHVELLGRGAVKITGEIESAADAGRPGGDVRVEVYGPVDVRGPEAQIVAHADGVSMPGTIRLRSEQIVTVSEGAHVGRAADAPVDVDLVLGGDVEIQAADVRVEDGAWVEAGTGLLQGGAVRVAAGENLAVGGGSVVRSGAGAAGGSLVLEARRIGIGQESVVAAGRGRSSGARFEIEAVESLDIFDGAMVHGGPTVCGPGGAVRATVSGALKVRGGANLTSGNGSVEFGNGPCNEPGAGGDVVVFAHTVDALEAAISAGRGYPVGTVQITEDEDFEVRPPRLAVRTSGLVTSKVFDRGTEAIAAPTLVSAALDTPAGTTAEITLCGGFDPELEAPTCVALLEGADLTSLENLQYFRYEISLAGRLYDAPTLDYFEIDFAP